MKGFFVPMKATIRLLLFSCGYYIWRENSSWKKKLEIWTLYKVNSAVWLIQKEMWKYTYHCEILWVSFCDTIVHLDLVGKSSHKGVRHRRDRAWKDRNRIQTALHWWMFGEGRALARHLYFSNLLWTPVHFRGRKWQVATSQRSDENNKTLRPNAVVIRWERPNGGLNNRRPLEEISDIQTVCSWSILRYTFRNGTVFCWPNLWLIVSSLWSKNRNNTPNLFLYSTYDIILPWAKTRQCCVCSY